MCSCVSLAHNSIQFNSNERHTVEGSLNRAGAPADDHQRDAADALVFGVCLIFGCYLYVFFLLTRPHNVLHTIER